jgi:serine phosphatase RsbU (regulator of sigma subunit)
MDLGFVVLNTDTNELQFSGANNPLYLIQANNNKELTEIKGDRMPVAIHDSMNNFTNQIIQLQKEDIFYLMSDGYEDQFGGIKGKKFLSKNLKQILSEHCLKSMKEQKEILDKTIEDWKNNYGIKYEQTDDITVLGIKIN